MKEPLLDADQPAAGQYLHSAVAVAPIPATRGLDGRGIVNAALIVMLFFILSRITGLAREVIIGAQFGTSAELDAYLAAFRVPDLLFQLVAGGALGSAFIPTFSTHWIRGDQQSAWLLFRRVLTLLTLVLVVLTGVAALFALPLMRWVIAPGFTPAQQLLAAELMRWMLLSTVIFGASGLVMGALNGVQHFLLPAAAPVFYNGAIILGAWLLAPRMGIYGLVIGVVAGALLHLLVQLPGLRRFHVGFVPSLTLHAPDVRAVMRLMGPRALGLFFVQIHFLVNTILASGLAEGSVSALNYAWLLMLLPQGIFAQAIATAAFPTFAAQVAADQTEAMRHTFGQTLRVVLFLTVPAAVLLFVLRVPIVQVLLERGQFSAESTRMVAFALQFYAIGLVAHAGLEITVRAFYALHDTWTPVVVGVAAMLLNIALCFGWIGWLSYGGLALANSVATGVEMLILLWLLRRRMAGIEERHLLFSLGRALLATLVMAGTLWLWLGVVESSQWLHSLNRGGWLTAIGGLSLAVTTYCGVSWLLKSPELQPALALVLRKRR